ncbi:MAG: nucleoside-diphosphate kinase [Desulfurella sp.]
MEKTLSIIKPDALKSGYSGKIIAMLEENGFVIKAMKKLHLTKKQAEGFYIVHKDRPFYDSLCAFMSSGSVIVMVLEKENAIAGYRTLMGATDPSKAQTGTIRSLYAKNIEENAVHGSDSKESADFEISYFFSQLEII